MPRPFEQVLPLPAGSQRPAAVVETVAAAAAAAAAAVAAVAGRRRRWWLLLRRLRFPVERGWSGGAGPADRNKKTRLTCMLEHNTGTRGMFYVNFMCMYASSEIQTDVGQIKHFMLYVCMSNTYTYIQNINCFMCMYSSSIIKQT